MQVSVPNVIYVGNKPVMNYCLVVMSVFEKSDSSVILKARGRTISTAVDVAEVIRNKFMKGLNVKKIEIGTDELPYYETTRHISKISIELSKK